MIIACAYCSASTMASPASTVNAALRMSTGIRIAGGLRRMADCRPRLRLLDWRIPGR